MMKQRGFHARAEKRAPTVNQRKQEWRRRGNKIPHETVSV